MPGDSLVNQLSPTEAAWLAGFIDGDGAISRNITTKGRNREHGSYQTMVYLIQIGQKNRMVLDYIRILVGAGRVIGMEPRSTNLIKKPIHPTMHHRWSLGGRQLVQSLLVQLVPYLVIKKEKAERIMADTERWRDREDKS